MIRVKFFSILLLLSPVFIFFSGCSSDIQKKNQIKESNLLIFHAGSLSQPFKIISEEFMKENPNVKVLSEADGSVKCARKITELGKYCDIMASADYKVIDDFLIPEHAKWNIKFVCNEISIVYSEKSRYSNEINKNNWTDILLKDEVAIGRSNPDADPCGYRTIMMLGLAEKFYNKKGLTESVIQKKNVYVRPKEVDLLALLESGTIDYIFLYRSVAIQHGLKYLNLPDSINLKNPELNELYSTVQVEIAGEKPGEKISIAGEAIVYGLTVPDNAPEKDIAIKFLEFVLDPEKGLKILQESGHPEMKPYCTGNYSVLPEQIKKLVRNY